MITNKLYGVREIMVAMIVAALLFVGASMTYAQTFTPPSGYSQMGSSGIYYNDRTGLYYNPVTGQYTNLQPLGMAQRDVGGNFIVPSGYTQQGSSGYFYNSSSGYYYDPSTGFYSTTAPVNTGVTAWMAQNYTPPTTGTGGGFTPGVPNTGAGGNTAITLSLLALLAVAGVTGAVSLSRKAM